MRNRAGFPMCRAEIVAFLGRNRAGELEDRVIKELRALVDDRIAVRFVYGWGGTTTRATGSAATAARCGRSMPGV